MNKLRESTAMRPPRAALVLAAVAALLLLLARRRRRVRCRRRRGGAGRRPRARQGAQDRGVLLRPRVRVGPAKYVASQLLLYPGVGGPRDFSFFPCTPILGACICTKELKHGTCNTL
jgi:hypothetical protein